jgi:hypothetical protein
MARSARGRRDPELLEARRAQIYRVRPWEHNTGPKTEAGKARSSMNGLKHGLRSRDLARRTVAVAAAQAKAFKEAADALNPGHLAGIRERLGPEVAEMLEHVRREA